MIIKKLVFLLFIMVLLGDEFIFGDIHDKPDFQNSFFYSKQQELNFTRDGFYKEKDNDIITGNGILLSQKTNKSFLIDSITALRTTGKNTKHTMEYDVNGNIITKLWQESDNNEYANFYRNSYCYENDLLISELEEKWERGQWDKMSLTTYHYASSNNPDTILVSIWENEEWMKYFREIYTYQENDSIESYSYEIWRDGSWSLDCEVFSEYQNNLLIKRVWRQWGNELLLFSIQNYYQYGKDNQLIYTIEKTAFDSVWINSERIFYRYDSGGLCVSDSMEEWSEERWKKSVYNLYAYDEYGNKTSETRQNWNGQWIKTVQDTYAYDINGNTTSQLRKNWRENQWVNYSLRNYQYDENGNLFHLTYRTWKDSAWVPDDAGILTFIDHNNTNYQYYAAEVMIYHRLFTNIEEHDYTEPIFSLSQNYPNPFYESTVISYSIPSHGFVELKIYDILGREIRTLVQEEKSQGDYEAILRGKDLPSGIYFYQLKFNRQPLTKKLFHIK